MFDDEFLHSLPDDADEGLAILFQKLSQELERWRYEAAQDSNSTYDHMEAQRSLLTKVFAYIAAHDLPLDLNREAPGEYQAFDLYYRDVLSEIEFYIAKTTFERAARAKVVTTYVLEPGLKQKIHHYISQIRVIIAESTLTENKRDALSKKLNVFADEVDRNRTRIDVLASAIIWTRKEIDAGAKGLEPIVEKLDSMFQSMAKATEWLKLPSPNDKKQLPSPPKRIEHKRELDDEVPF